MPATQPDVLAALDIKNPRWARVLGIEAMVFGEL